MPLKRLLALVLVLPFLAVGGLYTLEYLTSDAATRLAFQIRNQSLLLTMSNQTTRTFTHSPASWPNGVSNDYRIEITEGSRPAYYRASGPSAWREISRNRRGMRRRTT